MQIFCFIFNGSDWINTPRGNYVRQPGGGGGKDVFDDSQWDPVW